MVFATPAGQQPPSGTVITVTPSTGVPLAVNLNPSGTTSTFKPTGVGTVTFTFSNNKGLSDPPTITTTVRPGVEQTTHPAPAFTGGNQLSNPGPSYLPQLTSTTRRAFNAFMQGEAVGFVIPAQVYVSGITFSVAVNGYEARDFDGNIVASGPIVINSAAPVTLMLPGITAPGWYKLKLFNTANSGTFGDAAGDLTFCILPAGTSLPTPGIASYNPYLILPDGTTPTSTVSASPFPYFTAPNGNPVYRKFTGTITPMVSGNYTFSDDPICVQASIAGTTVLNRWNSAYTVASAANSGDLTVNLTAGQTYPVQIENMLGAGAGSGSLHLVVNGSRSDMASLFADENGVSGGLTCRTYTAIDGGRFAIQTNQYLRACLGCAAGPQRLGVGPNNTAADYTSNIAVFLSMQKNRDGGRLPAKLVFSFPDYPTNFTAGSVKTFISGLLAAGLTDADFVVECRNEPNDQNPSTYAGQFAQFCAEVKAADSAVQIVGPATVNILPNNGGGLDWWTAFLQAGATRNLDALSFHFYNCMEGDWNEGRYVMDNLVSYMANNGLTGKNLYQTEQGDAYPIYGVNMAYHSTQWTMARALLFEQYGLASEHNYQWEDRSDDPNWFVYLESDQGSPMPNLVAMRTWGAELFGKKLLSNYSFGSSRDRIYMGSLFAGASSSVAVFVSGGDSQGSIPLSLTGASSVTVVQWDGKTSSLTASGGQIALPVGVHPVYVRLPAGASLTVPGSGWGANLLAGVSGNVSDGSTTTALTDGVFGTSRGVPRGPWSGPSPQYAPTTIEFDYTSRQTFNRLHIYCPMVWQNMGSLLDYRWDYWDGSAWQRLVQHFENVHLVPAYNRNTWSTLDDYFQRRTIFQDTFPAVSTNKLRLTVNATTYGGAPMLYENPAGGQSWNVETLTISQIEAYNETSSTTSTPVNNWINTYYPQTPSSQITALLASTPNHDGITVLEEYFFDLTPGAPPKLGNLPQGAIVTQGTAQYLTLTYTSNPAATDIQAIPEMCTDLLSGSWTSVVPDAVVPSISNQADGAIITQLKFLVRGATQEFLRLRLQFAQ